MIYLTSDLHGDINCEGLQKYLEMATEKDVLIVLGDLELNFQDTEENQEFTNAFLSVDKTILFIDGNHENHPYLRSFPIETRYGAPVKKLSNNVFYLQRGNVYEIEGKRFFVMGGCKSSAKWKEMGLVFDYETPSQEELAFAKQTLQSHGNKVDYILTHYRHKDDAPTGYDLDDFTKYVDKTVDYRHWYCGHWHGNRCVDEKHTILYQKLLVLQ